VLAVMDIPDLLPANEFFIKLVSLVSCQCLCPKRGAVGNDI
jgi:hypothetical protein